MNTFELERKKHKEFYLPFYQEKNWIVHEDNILKEIKSDWDVRLEVFAGDIKKVDEKVRKGEFDDCLIEIIQDIKTQNWGWLFGDKDWVLYGSWANIETIRPSSLYLINMFQLKQYIFKLDGFLQTLITSKNWGTTWNIIRTWGELKSIAQKII